MLPGSWGKRSRNGILRGFFHLYYKQPLLACDITHMKFVIYFAKVIIFRLEVKCIYESILTL